MNLLKGHSTAFRFMTWYKKEAATFTLSLEAADVEVIPRMTEPTKLILSAHFSESHALSSYTNIKILDINMMNQNP